MLRAYQFGHKHLRVFSRTGNGEKSIKCITCYNFRDFLLGRQLKWISVRFAIAHRVHSGKRSTLKGKNLLLFGSKFFPCRVDPYLKWIQNNFKRVATTNNLSCPTESVSSVRFNCIIDQIKANERKLLIR